MKRSALALTLLLAAAIFLLAPLAAKETGWLRIRGSAAGMGTEPVQPPGQPADTKSRCAQAKGVEGEIAGNATPGLEQGKHGDHVPPDTPGTSLEKDTGPLPEKVADAVPKPWRGQTRTVPGKSEPEPVREQDGGAPSKIRRPAEEKSGQEEGAEPAGESEENAKKAQVQQGKSSQIRLFQTAAFRGNFNALPKWKRVLSKAEAEVRQLDSCTPGKGCPPGAASWQRIMAQSRGLAPFEKLKTVNAFFNKWPYRLDQDAYGTSDWWATPQEFLKLSGDCEDFAITKYFALRELGFSPEDLRIVVLKDRIRGIAHAVLAVFMDGDAYVLDNVTSVIFSHSKFRHYVPYYSLNEKYRWSHIPLDTKP